MRDKEYIFTPDGHIKIIQEIYRSTSSCKGNPFIVEKMKQEDFLDCSVLRKVVTPRKDSDTRFVDACYFRVSDKYKIGYELDDSYASLFDPDMPTTKIRLNKGKDETANNAMFTLQQEIPRKYHSIIPLSKEKIKDVNELVRQLVPLHFRENFWDRVLAASNAANNGIVEETASDTEIVHDDLLGTICDYDYE